MLHFLHLSRINNFGFRWTSIRFKVLGNRSFCFGRMQLLYLIHFTDQGRVIQRTLEVQVNDQTNKLEGCKDTTHVP